MTKNEFIIDTAQKYLLQYDPTYLPAAVNRATYLVACLENQGIEFDEPTPPRDADFYLNIMESVINQMGKILDNAPKSKTDPHESWEDMEGDIQP